MNKEHRKGVDIEKAFKAEQYLYEYLSPASREQILIQPVTNPKSKNRFQQKWNTLIAPVHSLGRKIMPKSKRKQTRDAIIYFWEKIHRVLRKIFPKHKKSKTSLFTLGKSIEDLQSSINSLSAAVSKLEIQSDACNQDIINRLSRVENYSYHALQRCAISCEKTLLVRTQVGYVAVDSQDFAVIAVLTEGGELERGTRLLLSKVLCPGDTFIDIGANLGLVTLSAARAMQGKGHVFCFEPFPRTVELLRHTLFINGFAEMAQVYPFACSDKTGKRTLHIGKTCGHNSLFPLLGATDTHQSVEVDVVCLDDAVPADSPVSFLKIDAEGAELDIVKGAGRILNDNKNIAVFVEYGLSHLQRTGHTTQEFLDAFIAFGFSWRIVDSETGQLSECSVEKLEEIGATNLLFIRPDSVIWSKL